MISRLDRLQGRDIYENTALAKINELVDAVNEMQAQVTILEEHAHPTAKILEDFRWIGCICRFWYDNPNDTLVDYLDKIQQGKNGVEYYAKESGDWFPHCNPVLPTDNAIYKGGDNDDR